MPPEVRAYTMARLPEVEVKAGMDGVRKVDADRLLLILTSGLKEHALEAARPLAGRFDGGQPHPGLAAFEAQLKRAHVPADHAKAAEMLLDAQELSEMLGEPDGLSAQAFAATCVFHGSPSDGGGGTVSFGGGLSPMSRRPQKDLSRKGSVKLLDSLVQS